MEAAPAPPLEMMQAEFVLELLVVSLDPPAELGLSVLATLNYCS
jgi:hypothetical protein